jgi:MtN3 and saliva related transmembrane protein
MTLILASGLALWVVYGVLQADAVIVIANAIAMVLAFSLTALKLRHG